MRTRHLSLRQRLFMLALAAILPLAAMAGLALLALADQHRAQAERASIETARALTTAVDAALYKSAAVLGAMAALVPEDPRALREYHVMLKNLVATQPEWVFASVVDPRGKPLIRTDFEFGAQLPPLAEHQSFAEALRNQAPSFGYLARGPGGRFLLPIRFPVLREGRVVCLLTAVVRPNSFVELLNRQRLPPDWIASIFDGSGLRIARSRQNDDHIGTPATPSLQKLMAQNQAEGTGLTTTLEGDQVYTAYSRSHVTGWTVAIGIPPSTVEAGATRSIMTFGGGILLSIALGSIVALFIGRNIAVPIAALGATARAMGRHEPLQRPQTHIREIRTVADTLYAAANQQAEDAAEREKLLRREHEARTLAEAANRAKDEFLAMLGHELRNPLSAIANARLLLDHPHADATALAHAKGVIGRQVDHLGRMTDDLLDAARALTGKIILQRRPVELAAATRHALAALKSGDRTITQKIVEQLDPVWVDADPTRLEQIITNLLGNAVKFTLPEGRISVRVGHEDHDAVLRVADDGIGMSADFVARVFEPFVQGESGLDRSRGGLGLGLTLVKRLSELHGGQASAHSDGPHRGSEFIVRLPAIEAPVEASRDGTSGSSVPSREILVIDDHEDARESLRMLLELDGHRVSVAGDALAGLEALRARPADIALIDIGLPHIDGYELVRRMRAEFDPRLLPRLIALTGYGTVEDRERARRAGFDLHLVKPVDLAQLKDALMKA